MNKRIQKKVAKRQQQDQLGVADAYHEIEQGVRDLAQALLSHGKEQSSAVLASMVEKLEASEQDLEKIVAKVPGVGPQLASMLHNLAHESEEEPAQKPVAAKKPGRAAPKSVRPSAGSRS